MSRCRTAALLAALVGAGLAPAQAAETTRSDLVNRTALRVCADPANLPFSNEKGEGFAGTPPGNVMARLGLIEQARPYPLMIDPRYDSPGERMVDDIRSGAIDAGVLWGPMAGYFAAHGGEKLLVVPLLKETGTPRMAYRITFGVRNLEDDWKRELNRVIAKRQGEIDAILLQFGVPLLDEQSKLITEPRR